MKIILALVALIVLTITRIYLVIPGRDRAYIKKKNKRTKPCKTCVFLGSGGHTAEMLQLVKSLNSSHYYPRTYIVANTDILSKEKAIEYEQSTGQQNKFQVHTIPRAREVGQPWSKVPLTALIALAASVKIIITSWPDLVSISHLKELFPLLRVLDYLQWTWQLYTHLYASLHPKNFRH
ncbi:unnamed protein product [Mucor circinelloides]